MKNTQVFPTTNTLCRIYLHFARVLRGFTINLLHSLAEMGVRVKVHVPLKSQSDAPLDGLIKQGEVMQQGVATAEEDLIHEWWGRKQGTV